MLVRLDFKQALKVYLKPLKGHCAAIGRLAIIALQNITEHYRALKAR